VTVLRDAALPTTSEEQLARGGLAVVVSSNLGNLDTVCRVVETIRAESVAATSPLDLPNASSNVIASTLAIRFGAPQANLRLCNGATSGVDAVHVAANLVRAGRARRALVIGVEVATEAAVRLLSASAPGSMAVTPSAVAIGVLVENADDAAARGARPYAAVGAWTHGSDEALAEHLAWAARHDPLEEWSVPVQCGVAARHAASALALRTLRVSAAWGADTYGAAGVAQVAAACRRLSRGTGRALVSAGAAWRDGLSSIILGAPRRAA
jgi:3-oxoacyl-[acyl-carrier-protein] synthase II